jgi:glycopeptide antibiotics resistance protein
MLFIQKIEKPVYGFSLSLLLIFGGITATLAFMFLVIYLQSIRFINLTNQYHNRNNGFLHHWVSFEEILDGFNW